MFSTQGDWYLHVNCFSVASDVGHDSMLDEHPMGEKQFFFFFLSCLLPLRQKTIGGTEALLLFCCSRISVSAEKGEKECEIELCALCLS